MSLVVSQVQASFSWSFFPQYSQPLMEIWQVNFDSLVFNLSPYTSWWRSDALV